MNTSISLKQITWGGRIRRAYQKDIWAIASEAAVDKSTSHQGSMVSSSQTNELSFLDGGVWVTYGFFDASSGMHWSGEHAKAYILYKLGLDPRALLGKKSLPELSVLEEELKYQKETLTCNDAKPQKRRDLPAKEIDIKKSDLKESREDPHEIIVDPWLKKPENIRKIPQEARLACAYDMGFGLDSCRESAFFCRTDTRDELWIQTGGSRTGRVFAFPKEDEESAACLVLMDRYIRSKVGYEWPERFVSPGIITKSSFESLLEQIEAELEENTKKALEKEIKSETEIVRTARELGLGPEPTGTDPKIWKSRCPGTNHHLYINAAENSFGCGWCKRKGAVEELKAFVKERKNRI